MPQFLSRLRLFLLQRLQPGEQQMMLLLAALVGVSGALATIGFRELLDLLGQLVFGRSDGLVNTARNLLWWQRLLAPAVGGVLAGLVLQRARRYDAPNASRDYMEAVTLGDGQVAGRASLLRASSSALSVASGASIGREAPMIQLAALTASVLGRWRNLPRARLRLLVACGAAAGISAAYNAPIAGALFVAEIVLQSFAIETLGPLIVASVVANLTAHNFLGYAPLYQMPAFDLHLGLDVIPFSLLGILAGLAAPAFLLLLQWAKKPGKWLAWPLWAQLGLGGLIVGAISVLEPGVWGNGYSVVNSILKGDWLWPALLLMLVFKVFATAAATGSGAVGGVFTPTLFVGAVLGALFGLGLHALWPAAAPLPAYIAAGMGAFLSACAHAPLMSAVMIFEMTGNPRIIVPLLLVCVLSAGIKRLLWQPSLYSHSLPAARLGKGAGASVRSLLRSGSPTVQDSASIAAAEEAFLSSRWQHIYVTNADGIFLGALSLHDFTSVLRDAADSASTIPLALLRRDYPRITLASSLGEIFEAFSHHRGERLPVLDADGVLQGYVSKTDLMLVLQEEAAQS
ncbi:MAG: voltage-gated chloride channel protein ClcB [Proteobacteria bacterium]|nr:voltage-gated chloride channel protein ClcB [Pseudomonadota bacterium]